VTRRRRPYRYGLLSARGRPYRGATELELELRELRRFIAADLLLRQRGYLPRCQRCLTALHRIERFLTESDRKTRPTRS